MSYLKRYFIWSAVYLAAWLWLFLATDFRLNIWQGVLLLVALNCYGASQRNHARWEENR